MDEALKEKLVILTEALIDQERAQVLVQPQENASGYWFGGGNLIQDGGGDFALVGRYRNHGDSRTGLAAGERGLELAILMSPRFQGPFEGHRSFSKADLAVGDLQVLSIEGSALFRTDQAVELFLSSEKDIDYPEAQRLYQKPGTGIWSIDKIAAEDIGSLDASNITSVLASTDPPTLHIKDPVAFPAPNSGTAMIYCSHPFSWASSNSGLALRAPGDVAFRNLSDSVLPRGFVWDVAVTRITDRMPIPQIGAFKNLPPLALYFYDGAECIREHEQSSRGVVRARGHSCEEIGGVAWGFDGDFPEIERLSINGPLFVSPHGTGCSRYTSTLVTNDAIYATWQQSQPDQSQPLVGHSLTMEQVERILS